MGRRVQVTEAVFDFYLAVFDGLLNQMGVACAQKAVHTFLQTFTQHNIQVTLQQENSHGIRAIERSVDRLGPVFFFIFYVFFSSHPFYQSSRHLQWREAEKIARDLN